MDHCCENKGAELAKLKEKQATVLKIVMAINFIMFFGEFGAGLAAESTALMADSLDMLGDAFVYAFSLYVLHKSTKWRASAALAKGIIILVFGLCVLGEVAFKLSSDSLPVFSTMGIVGFIALVANGTCLALLYSHRADDLNMRSTWICSRNDILSNVGVLLAAALVAYSGSKWPDIAIGLLIAILFLRSALPILVESIKELRLKPNVQG